MIQVKSKSKVKLKFAFAFDVQIKLNVLQCRFGELRSVPRSEPTSLTSATLSCTLIAQS